ncbi:MAG: sigma-70 family RNA polymerase sigma factor [Planctomycetota bacterium]|nr:sigma-70 family RNA polymerase sigma factor [Planctomycetota bacterium]
MTETSLSLLQRLQQRPDNSSWQKLVDLYTPLIGRWLSRSPLQQADRDDLVQEVLQIVVQKLPEFQRRREGSFRAWLRTVSVNCLREFWRSSKQHPVATGDSDFLQQLQELEDPHSALAQTWDTEHDRYVVRRLLERSVWAFSRQTIPWRSKPISVIVKSAVRSWRTFPAISWWICCRLPKPTLLPI